MAEKFKSSLSDQEWAKSKPMTTEEIRRRYPQFNRTKRVYTPGPGGLTGSGGFMMAGPGDPGNPLAPGVTRGPGGVYAPNGAFLEKGPSDLQRVMQDAGPGAASLIGSIERDRELSQERLDEAWFARRDAQGDFRDAVNAGSDSILASATDTRDMLLSMAQGDRDEYIQREKEIISEFTDTSAAQASVMGLAINRQAKQQYNNIMNNSELSSGEKQAQLQQLEQQTAENVTANTTQIAVNYVRTKAELATNLLQGRVSVFEISANMRQQAAQLYTAGVAAAAQFRAQGLQAYADMIEARPVVAMATGITQLIAMAQSGRVPNFSGFGGGGGVVTSNPNNNQGLNMGFSGFNAGREKFYASQAQLDRKAHDKALADAKTAAQRERELERAREAGRKAGDTSKTP